MVNFKLGDKCDKDKILNITRAWVKEKNLSPGARIKSFTSWTLGKRSIH